MILIFQKSKVMALKEILKFYFPQEIRITSNCSGEIREEEGTINLGKNTQASRVVVQVVGNIRIPDFNLPL